MTPSHAPTHSLADLTVIVAGGGIGGWLQPYC